MSRDSLIGLFDNKSSLWCMEANISRPVGRSKESWKYHPEERVHARGRSTYNFQIHIMNAYKDFYWTFRIKSWQGDDFIKPFVQGDMAWPFKD